MAVEYKCENCAATLRFDVESNMLVCDYCESEFAVDYIEERMGEKESGASPAPVGDEENWEDSYVNTSDENAPKMQVKQRTCPSCGGILLGDEVSAATFCAYCGNAALTDAVIADTRIPDYIIPFKNTKEAAQKAFIEWGKKGFVTPGDFTSASVVEKITGMYVPFYLYSCKADCDYTAEGFKVYTKHFLGREFEITEHYDVRRDITDRYCDIPADASEKMKDETMDLLEPFDFSELEVFKKAYMSGFFADKYSYEDKEMADRIAQRVISYTKESAAKTITGYDSFVPKGSKTNITWDRTKYCMLPVWILNYNYNGKNYEIAINGQTGRIVGEKPVSAWKSALLYVLWFVPAAIVITVIAAFFLGFGSPLCGIVCAAIIALLAMLAAQKKQKTSMKAERMDYKSGATVMKSQTDRFVKKTRKVVKKN